MPPLVLKARHLSGSTFCMSIIGVSEQALGRCPLGLGLVGEDSVLNFHAQTHLCTLYLTHTHTHFLLTHVTPMHVCGMVVLTLKIASS